jgi:SPP1 family phage portal protein
MVEYKGVIAMLQMQRGYLDNEKNINDIVQKSKQILSKRKLMYERYKRTVGTEIKVPLEYYIANIATGYFGGKAPKYTVKQEANEENKNIIQKLFNKVVGKNADSKEMQMIINFIRDYNDDSAFFYELVFDYMTTNACYWLEYETIDNEIVYARIPSTQSVAIYDYSTPVQKIGGIRIWQETDADGFNCDMVEVITDTDRRYYKNSKKAPEEYKEDIEQREDVKWKLVPFNAVENPDGLSIYEPVLTLIDAYETVIKNNKHLFEYNDDAKLKITGFTPQNPLMIQDEKGNWIKNPDRTKEDNLILEAPTFYTPDNSGDIAWITKDINDTASENHKKTLIELILMISMIPSISEISTKEKTATEIERSFFPLEQVLTRADKLFKKELLAMWENIIARINVKKGTNYDFREIQIELQRNLPTDKDSMVNMALQLREVLSEETVLSMLPFDIDIESEISKKKEESAENFNANMELIKNQTPKEEEDINVEETEQNRE